MILDETMLQAGAGSDFMDPIASATNQILCNIKPKSAGWTWRINVHKQDIYWDNNLRIDIRRQPYTGLNGGLNYFELNDIDQEFFNSTVRKNTSGVQIQFQLRGASVSLTPTTYTTTIVYTIVDM